MTALPIALISLSGIQGCEQKDSISIPIKLNLFLNLNGSISEVSGVWKIVLQNTTSFPNPGSMVITSLIGDAIHLGPVEGLDIFVALASSRIFAHSTSPTRLAEWECVPLLARSYGVSPEWGEDGPVGLRQLLAEAPTPPAELSHKDYPSLIAFSDPSRPETGRLADPTDLTGRGSGGPRIEKLEIQVVDEAVSRGPASKLPWLRSRGFAPNSATWNDFPANPQYFSR